MPITKITSAISPVDAAKRTKPQLQRSIHLAPGASEWQGNVQCSLHIASDCRHPSHLVRDNLPAQRAIIALCLEFIGHRFIVHIPHHGALVLSCLQLRSFAKLPHTVSGFSLEKSWVRGCIWKRTAAATFLALRRGLLTNLSGATSATASPRTLKN